jgi:uracil-DNA glycosylase
MTPSSLDQLVEQIRAENHGKTIPGFDPKNGNETARFLFLLEAPGPNATEFVSLHNEDPTARNLTAQFTASGVDHADIALWNVVPWYIGNKEKTKIRAAVSLDIKEGQKYLIQVLALMPKLKCVVLVGEKARRAHVYLSSRTDARILSCHHTSAQAQNTMPEARDENIAVFKHMLTLNK